MSPERPGARQRSTRSDLYSVSVMLYESLTGVHPHSILDRSPGRCLLPDDAT
jgi:serine/threonine protein kinase